MRRSYQRLVKASKAETLSHIRAAWDKPGRKGNADPDDTHPSVAVTVREAYLRDVPGHLSIQPWRWVAVAIRNWSES